MRKKVILLSAFASMTLAASPTLAQDFSPHPVVEAMLQASPSARLEAAKFVKTSYPGMGKDLIFQLKASYPQLEHKLVDAGLKTWQEHPGEMASISEEVKIRYGTRLEKLRRDLDLEMEASYPDYRRRLSKVLEQHGAVTRWGRFMEAYHAPLYGQVKREVDTEVPEAKPWYPGKFRAMWAQSEAGRSPVFDRLHGMVSKNPDLAPRLAARLVALTRESSPGLAEDLTKHVLDNQGQLVDALRSEFPGADLRVVALVERIDPTLHKEIGSFVRQEAKSIRADFRANLESELPGFEARLSGILTQRYPQLQEQVLQILKG